MGKSVSERFWGKVDVRGKDDCWEWRGTKPGFGHGQFWKKGKVVGAHRVAYELSRGPIRRGLHVLHKCDNPGCVNPDHLYLGSQKDNVRDAVTRGRWSHGNPQNMVHGIGEDNVLAKLTARQVKRIRELHERGFSQQDIAERFGVARSTIGQIVRNETWTHIDS